MTKIPLKRPKALIFDVDKTLTQKTSWYGVTSQLGVDGRKHAELYNNYQAGILSYDDVRSELMNLIHQNGQRPVTKEMLDEVFLRIQLRTEAYATFTDLEKRGYILCLISSSIDLFVKSVAERLGANYWYANSELQFDENGHWVDFEYNLDETGLKVKQLDDFLAKTELTTNDVIAIGDGASDTELFQQIPGVAVFCNDDHLAQMAWKKLDNLPKLIQLLDSLPE